MRVPDRHIASVHGMWESTCMNRRPFKLGLLLLAGGAIVNIAVAWGCMHEAIGGSGKRTTMDKNVTKPTIIVNSSRTRWQISQGHSELTMTTRGFYFRPEAPRLPGCSAFAAGLWHKTMNRLPPHKGTRGIVENLAGWPLLSLHDVTTEIDDCEGGRWRKLDTEFSGSIEVPELAIRRGLPSRVPISMLWPGFAINTISYAAILWVVFFVPGKLKRTLRRRRGLCPACAYPIGTSTVCTECGNTVTAHCV